MNRRCLNLQRLRFRRPGLLNAGFTLIELMAVLAIVVIISLIILVSASRFNSAILLRSLAYEVGLSIREAQLYGVAVKSTPGNTPVQCGLGLQSQFCSSFGVDFSNPTSIVVFADLNNDHLYEAPPTDAKADSFAVLYGFTVNNFCASTGSIVECKNNCPAAVAPGSITGFGGQSCGAGILSKLDITFTRPNPDAYINAVSSDNALGTPPYNGGAFIEVQSPGNSCRSVSVSSTGQITITGNSVTCI